MADVGGFEVPFVVVEICDGPGEGVRLGGASERGRT